MGFLSFHKQYYNQKIEQYESHPLSSEELLEARRILKMLDDLEDEGYVNLNNALDSEFHMRSRLRDVIRKNGSSPFELPPHPEAPGLWSQKSRPLHDVLDQLISEASGPGHKSTHPLLPDLQAYCRWIEQKSRPDQAIVFLLRDTLLPYIWFSLRGYSSLHSWLVSRAFLDEQCQVQGADDDIRLAIYEALEQGYTEWEDFFDFCKQRILNVLENYPVLKENLLALLQTIPENRILIVESGYCGTIPLMLAALDERADFCLFATAPYLIRPYKNRIFCEEFEKMREFETLASQDLLLQYDHFVFPDFYVKVNENPDFQKQALEEIRAMLPV